MQAAVEGCLARYAAGGQALCLALSGGRDSVVLLHCLQKYARSHTLRAVHIDHGLHPESAQWAKTCVRICATLAVPLQVCKVVVARDSGLGLEAAARDVRYAALSAALAPGELLLTAHHRNDQLETLLLQLLRGAGVHGIAAMPAYACRDGSTIIRPFLDVSVAAIRDFADAQALQWIEDPSNQDLSLDRNYLRQEIVPLLEQRWPAAGRSMARTARLSGEAAGILDELADADLESLLAGNRIQLPKLQRLSPARQRNAIRRALRRLGLAVPAEKQLVLMLKTMQEAREDAQPLIAWPGVHVHRYQDVVWLFAESADPVACPAAPRSYSWNPQTVLDMGPVRGTLSAEACRGEGIAAALGDAELQVRFRQGGESLRPAATAATRDLKNLLQESHVVPWMRSHIPLIYHGERLLAVGDLWVSAECAAQHDEPGIRIVWAEHADIR